MSTKGGPECRAGPRAGYVVTVVAGYRASVALPDHQAIGSVAHLPSRTWQRLHERRAFLLGHGHARAGDRDHMPDSPQSLHALPAAVSRPSLLLEGSASMADGRRRLMRREGIAAARGYRFV